VLATRKFPLDLPVKVTIGYSRPVPRGASSRGVVKVGRDAAPASVVNITTSSGGGGEPSRGTKTAGRSDRTVEGVKPEMPRDAPSWRGASADAPGSGDPGPPGMIVRAVRRNPDNASSRRVPPLISRGGKETGPPRARPKSGISIALATSAKG